MLSFKDWKSLNESYDFSLGLATPNTVGIQSQSGFASFAELLEAKKKMKKKMFGDEEIPDEEDEEEVEVPEEGDEEEVEDDDAETGDGEVVEPSAPKDKEMEPEGGKAAFLARMKKKMKKKMAAEGTQAEPIADDAPAAEGTEDAWFQSIKSMITFQDPRNDGLTDYTNEDALMPFIDPNTGFARKPVAGEVGFAPQGKIGEEE